jgi:hypothetical protein
MSRTCGDTDPGSRAPSGPGRGPGLGRALWPGSAAGCVIPGCTARVDPSRLMCRADWYQVPKPLRDRAWSTWRSGRAASSPAHAIAVQAAVAAVACNRVRSWPAAGAPQLATSRP